MRNSLNDPDVQVPLSAMQGYIMSRDIPWYGTSSTAASTIEKTATTSDGKFALVTGAPVRIKFTCNNTASAPTLNVDSTGAKSIKAYGTTAPTSWWQAGDVVTFTYDGTNWIMQSSHGQFESYKTRSAHTLLWQGSISHGDTLKFDPGDTSRFKALSFKLYYSPVNQITSCIMPIECFQTSNVSLMFGLVGSVYIIGFVPTYIKTGATIDMKRVDNGASETAIKLTEVYGILK